MQSKKHYNNNTQLTGAPILDIDNYLKKPPNDFFASDFINFFKKELFDRLAQNDYVNKHPVLNQLIVFLDATKPDHNRIMGFYHLCSTFHWVRDLDPMPDKNNDIAIMIAILMQDSGGVRQRCLAFALLYQLYGRYSNLVGEGYVLMYPALRFECADGSIMTRLSLSMIIF